MLASKKRVPRDGTIEDRILRKLLSSPNGYAYYGPLGKIVGGDLATRKARVAKVMSKLRKMFKGEYRIPRSDHFGYRIVRL